MLAAFVPATFVTKTLALPAGPAGETAVSDVAEVTVTPVAATPPNVTRVVSVKSVPVIVTDVPPSTRPEFGVTALTVGGPTGGSAIVSLPPGIDVDVPTVTINVSVPEDVGGIVQLTLLEDIQDGLVHVYSVPVWPVDTVIGEETAPKPDPVRMTVVAILGTALDGLTCVITGMV